MTDAALPPPPSPPPAPSPSQPTARSPDPASPPAPPLGSDPSLLDTLWQSPYPATLQDEDFRLVDVNEAFVAFCGRPRSQLLGLDPVVLQPPADRPANVAQRHSFPALDDPNPAALHLRRRLIDAEGRERWFQLAGQVLRLRDGRRLWLCVLQDLTSERQALDESQRAQDELALWFELCPVGMLLFDGDGAVIRTNPAFEALVGQVLIRLHDAGPDLQRLLGWPAHDRGERLGTVALPDGRRRRLLARVRSLPGDGRGRRTMAVVEDRSAEEERDVARLEIGMLMDTASVGVATFDPARGWLQPQPPAAATPAGPAPAAASSGLQGIGRELVDEASLPEYERLQQALRRRERAEVRYAVNHPQSGRRWLLTRVEPARLSDGRDTMSVVTLDISDQERSRLRSEQLLRELSTILEGSTAGIAYLRGELLVRCNLRFERLLGFAAGEAAGATVAEAFGRRFDAPALLPALREAMQQGKALETELQALASAGSPPAWYSLSMHPAETAGAAREAVAVLADITRLKLQQAELEAVLQDRETMFNLSEVGIAYMRGPRIERANQALAELTGYAAPELSALDGAELYADARECVEFEAAITRALRSHGRFQGERRLRHRDGRLTWVEVAVRSVPGESVAGRADAVIASFIDVDERHRARESLLQQAERTRAVLDSVLVGIVTTSPRGISWMNRSARRMFGGELADFVGEDISVVATDEPDHPLRHTDLFLQRLDQGRSETFECQLRARDGRSFWVVGNVVVTGETKQGGELTFALLDIERRRQAEMRIAQAQASLQRVIETAPLAIALFDAHSLRVLQANQAAAGFLGRPLEAVLGHEVAAVLSPERARLVTDWCEAAALTPEVLHREWRDQTDAALAQVWDVRIVALAASSSWAAQMLVVASDVTEQRAADQARLQAAIAQREVLVREVHHRIKNNLQGVAGLLQQGAARQPELAPLLGEAVSQVQALAQVYGLQVGSSGRLRVAGVLQAIAGSVGRTFGRSIAVEDSAPELDDWVLPEAEAIPIALTLNELLTNAVKHGPAAVRCGAALAEDGVALHVANQGRLAAGFVLSEFPPGVSGLGLVRSLLPRRSSTLAIAQEGDEVVARIALRPPSVRRATP